MNIKELQQKLKNNKNDIYEMYNKIEYLKKENLLLEKQIKKLCVHEWEREYEDGIYGQRYELCKKCKLYK